MHQVGYILYLLGIIDVAAPFFGVDITGVSWSPLVFFGLGWILIQRARGGGASRDAGEATLDMDLEPEAEDNASAP